VSGHNDSWLLTKQICGEGFPTNQSVNATPEILNGILKSYHGFWNFRYDFCGTGGDV
jgi:hypothetical protein